MVRLRGFLSAVVGALASLSGFAAIAAAQTSDTSAAPANNPRLDAVFKSLQESTQGSSVEVPLMPFAIAIVAAIAMGIALKQWNRRRANPKPLHSQRKLLDEAAKQAGVPRRKLRRIESLAAADGLSSPLVAMLCPSAIKRLSVHVKTPQEQEALKSIVQTLSRAERRGHAVVAE